MKETDLEEKYKIMVSKISEKFGEEIDMQGILFLVGVQELGKGFMKFSKAQKLDLLHIAICKLLSGWGYYEFEGLDKDGWPHWKPTSKLPHLKPGQQVKLIKEALVEYFKEIMNYEL